MQIVTISGLDGSGKSTQIEMLKNYLESQKKRVSYFHAVDFSIANKIIKSTKKNSQSKSVIEANWFSIQLRKIFLKIDICRFKKLIKELEKKDYDYLVSDRYFYDTVINIEYLKIAPKARPLASQRPRLWSIPKPDLSFYLRIYPEIIMSRNRVPDQGIEYLKKKKELYENKMNLWNMKAVDGNRDKDVIFEEIKTYVNSR